MSKVTIIGTGNIGTAVATLAQRAGAEVQVLARDEAKSAALAQQVGGTSGTVGDDVQGDIVVLAVPYGALAELAAAYGTRLDGKVVVDVTNPLDFTTFDSLTVPADSSATAELQAALPGARVVKAFNTTFAGALASGQTGGVPTTVLVAGDDDAARGQVVDLVTGAGLAALSAGAVKRARELEAVAFLQMTLAAQEAISWNGGLALQK